METLKQPRTFSVVFALALSGLTFSACSVLFPDRSAPKSATYSIKPPEEPWRSVPVGESPSSIDALKADLAFEDTQTGAIMSLNSLCRKYTDASLDELARNLVLGIKNKQVVRDRFFELNGQKAKDTIIEGEVERAKVRIRTVVTKQNLCTYDFILVATPDRLEKSETAFEKFLQSFKAE